MDTYYIIAWFIIGSCLGSFFNVVGYRLPIGQSLIKPSSKCPKCNHQLRWYELIPIVSYIIQFGKCRKCGSKIALFYPLIELTTGLLFALAYYLFGYSSDFFGLLIVISFLVIVIVSDVNFLIIPDEITIAFTFIGLLYKFICFGLKTTFFSVLSSLFLFFFMYFVMILGNKIFKKESLGGGDIKLMLFIGIFVSPVLGLFSIFIASMVAFPISIVLFYKNRNNVIPFGPFLLFGLLIILVFQIDTSFITALV